MHDAIGTLAHRRLRRQVTFPRSGFSEAGDQDFDMCRAVSESPRLGGLCLSLKEGKLDFLISTACFEHEYAIVEEALTGQSSILA